METTPIFLVLAIAGFVEFMRRLHLKDYLAAITIAGAAILGALAGWFGAPGVPDVWNGIVGGLSASGLITALSHNGTSAGASSRLSTRR